MQHCMDIDNTDEEDGSQLDDSLDNHLSPDIAQSPHEEISPIQQEVNKEFDLLGEFLPDISLESPFMNKHSPRHVSSFEGKDITQIFEGDNRNDEPLATEEYDNFILFGDGPMDVVYTSEHNNSGQTDSENQSHNEENEKGEGEEDYQTVPNGGRVNANHDVQLRLPLVDTAEITPNILSTSQCEGNVALDEYISSKDFDSDQFFDDSMENVSSSDQNNSSKTNVQNAQNEDYYHPVYSGVSVSVSAEHGVNIAGNEGIVIASENNNGDTDAENQSQEEDNDNDQDQDAGDDDGNGVERDTARVSQKTKSATCQPVIKREPSGGMDIDINTEPELTDNVKVDVKVDVKVIGAKKKKSGKPKELKKPKGPYKLSPEWRKKRQQKYSDFVDQLFIKAENGEKSITSGDDSVLIPFLEENPSYRYADVTIATSIQSKGRKRKMEEETETEMEIKMEAIDMPAGKDTGSSEKGDKSTPEKLFNTLLRRKYNNQFKDALKKVLYCGIHADVIDRRYSPEGKLDYDCLMLAPEDYGDFDPPLNPTAVVKSSVNLNETVDIEPIPGGETVTAFIKRIFALLAKKDESYKILTSGDESIFRKIFVKLPGEKREMKLLEQEFTRMLRNKFMALKDVNYVGQKFLYYADNDTRGDWTALRKPEQVAWIKQSDWIANPSDDFDFSLVFDPPPLPELPPVATSSVNINGIVDIESIPEGETVTSCIDRIFTLLAKKDGSYKILTSGDESIFRKIFVKLPAEKKSIDELEVLFMRQLRARFKAQKDVNYVGQKFLYYADKDKSKRFVVLKKPHGTNESDWIVKAPPTYVLVLKDIAPSKPISNQRKRQKVIIAADHGQLERNIHHSVKTPVMPGTVLAKCRGVWRYYCDAASSCDMVGVVSKKPFNDLRKPRKGEFQRVVMGTCPARVLPSHVRDIMRAKKSGDMVFLCVTETTTKGYMELYTGQRNCEVVGYLGDYTYFIKNVPYYQGCKCCFHLNINQHTDIMLYVKWLKRLTKWIMHFFRFDVLFRLIGAFIIAMSLLSCLYLCAVNNVFDVSVSVSTTSVTANGIIGQSSYVCARVFSNDFCVEMDHTILLKLGLSDNMLLGAEDIEDTDNEGASSLMVYEDDVCAHEGVGVGVGDIGVEDAKPLATRSGKYGLCHYLNNRNISSVNRSTDMSGQDLSDYYHIMDSILDEYYFDNLSLCSEDNVNAFEEACELQQEKVRKDNQSVRHSVRDKYLLLTRIYNHTVKFNKVFNEKNCRNTYSKQANNANNPSTRHSKDKSGPVLNDQIQVMNSFLEEYYIGRRNNLPWNTDHVHKFEGACALQQTKVRGNYNSETDEDFLLAKINEHRMKFEKVCLEKSNNSNICKVTRSKNNMSNQTLNDQYQLIDKRLNEYLEDSSPWNEDRLEMFEKEHELQQEKVLLAKHSVRDVQLLLTRIYEHWPVCLHGQLVEPVPVAVTVNHVTE